MTMRTRGHARGGSREDGAVIVEFAAIFIVFAMLLWGLISYGVIFAAQQSLTHGASEAARAVVGMSDQGDARDRIDVLINEELGWLADFGGREFSKDDDVEFYDCGDSVCVRVSVSYDWDNHPIVPSILNVATPDTLSGRAVVQFR